MSREVFPGPMKLYIAGPMRGYVNWNVPLFRSTAERLRDAGHLVMDPTESFGGDMNQAMHHYSRHDVHLLLQAEGLVLLPGWERSEGACTEVAIAKWLGLSCFSLSQDNQLLVMAVPNPIDTFLKETRSMLP